MQRVRPRRTRHGRERALLTILGSLTCLFGLATLVVGYVVWSLTRIDRIDVAESLTVATDAPVTAADIIAAADSPPPGLGIAAAEEEGEPGFEDLAIHRPDRGAANYLLVGSDSVEGVDADDVILSDREEEAENHLADTIMILRLRTDGTAAVVSIPRDLWVEVSGTGRTMKINSAYNIDDTPADRAARLIDTVEQNLDIDLQHFVEVDLDGFRKMVDAVGGVSVCFEQPIRDRNTDDTGDPNRGGTGFVAAAGNQLLDGERALQYVRSRHLLVQDAEGDWVRLGYWNDLERNSRQQQFIFDTVDQALGDALSSPRTVQRLLDIVANNVTLSNTISLFDDGLDLARLYRSFDAETQLERYTLLFSDSQRSGLFGLDLARTDDNGRILDVFRGIGWNDVVESRVAVTVTGPGRSATSQALRDLGFTTSLELGSSTGTGSVIRYGVGGEAAAVVLATHLVPAPVYLPDPELGGNELVLQLGEEPVEVVAGYQRVSAPPPVTVAPVDTSTSAPAPDATEPTPEVEVAGVCG